MAQNPDMPGGQEITVVNENIEVFPNGVTRRGLATPPLMEDDSTLRAWALQVVRRFVHDGAGTRIPIEVVATEVQPIYQAPTLVPLSQGELWAPGTTSADLYEIRFTPVSNQSIDTTFTVGVEVGGAGGALTSDEIWVENYAIWDRTSDGEFGPYIIRGNDAIRGACAVNNGMTIHWNVKKIA